MNTSKTEFLSAFLDDEAGDFERRRLLDELKKDDALGQSLSRYALIGEAMRAGSSGQRLGAGVSLLGRIHEELEAEPVYNEKIVPFPAIKPKHGYRALGVGIAAAVVAVAVGGVLFLQQPAQAPATVAARVTPAQTSVSAPQVASADVDVRIQQLGRVDSETRDILKQYVAQHVKYASTTAVAPSIRAVSYANER